MNYWRAVLGKEYHLERIVIEDHEVIILDCLVGVVTVCVHRK